MSPNQQALQHFLRLAFLRTRHQQQEILAKGVGGNERATQLNKLKILEEIIREQLINEDPNSTTRASR